MHDTQSKIMTDHKSQEIAQCDPTALVIELRKDINKAINRVLDSGRYILGEEVEEFENEWASWCDVNHAIGCGSGTDALELILRGMNLPKNSRILAPSHTAVATIAAIVRAGHLPFLADINPLTYCIDKESIKRCINNSKKEENPIKAMICVHLYGQPCEINSIQAICQENNIQLIEDSSQAHGARWRKKKVGSLGFASAFSLYPTKNLGAIGDAGIVTTNQPEFAKYLKEIRQYGWQKPAISINSGINSRLDPIQAAILRVKLKYLEQNNERRKEIAKQYHHNLLNVKEIGLPPQINNQEDPVYHQFVIQVNPDQRKSVQDFLLSKGIKTLIHYPMAAHQMPAYRDKGWVGIDPNGLPNTEEIIPKIISLPMGIHLTKDNIDKVINSLKQAIKEVN